MCKLREWKTELGHGITLSFVESTEVATFLWNKAIQLHSKIESREKTEIQAYLRHISFSYMLHGLYETTDVLQLTQLMEMAGKCHHYWFQLQEYAECDLLCSTQYSVLARNELQNSKEYPRLTVTLKLNQAQLEWTTKRSETSFYLVNSIISEFIDDVPLKMIKLIIKTCIELGKGCNDQEQALKWYLIGKKCVSETLLPPEVFNMVEQELYMLIILAKLELGQIQDSQNLLDDILFVKKINFRDKKRWICIFVC